MSDVDQLVQQTVNMITTIAKKAQRFAGRLLLTTLIVCLGGLWLGVEALSGGIETVWIVLGTTFAAIAIGSAVVAWWRAGAVRHHVDQLAGEVRALIDDGYDPTNTVIETFEVVDGEPASDSSAIVMSRQMGGFREPVRNSPGRYVRLAAATKAMATFPLLAFAAIAISFVFAFLSFFFLVGLALS